MKLRHDLVPFFSESGNHHQMQVLYTGGEPENSLHRNTPVQQKAVEESTGLTSLKETPHGEGGVGM